MPNEQLKRILDYIKKGGTMDLIAKKEGMSLRTLSRKLQPYKEDVKINRAYYQSFIEAMFN